eukprot:CAMPEP_0202704372 /NCGR_PEP_ID=MMETSP1385-20130828/17054_1 /ASSEMBLY_ACC=CAM_ASM_000861 /TAXON_ID=933848 /ORGANISM="Elphidium margaritaceum" /LENGTH=74 /DNA_ID=CAMNT_0049362369 /DNA_START=204 /DNA_END=425 /DNA_ORIENTATION=-
MALHWQQVTDSNSAAADLRDWSQQKAKTAAAIDRQFVQLAQGWLGTLTTQWLYLSGAYEDHSLAMNAMNQNLAE